MISITIKFYQTCVVTQQHFGRAEYIFNTEQTMP